jgi:hypothetical protein
MAEAEDPRLAGWTEVPIEALPPELARLIGGILGQPTPMPKPPTQDEEDDGLDALGNSLLGASKMLALLSSTAEGFRQQLLGFGWDDHIAQHLAAGWLFKQLS